METLLILSFIINLVLAYLIYILWRNNKVLKSNLEYWKSAANYSPTLFDRISRMSPMLLGGMLAFVLWRKFKSDEKVDAAYIKSLEGGKADV